MSIITRLKMDWYHLADMIGIRFKGSSLKRRQKGVCILMGIIYALWWSLSSDVVKPLILIALLFDAVNMSYTIYLSMGDYPPVKKRNKE